MFDLTKFHRQHELLWWILAAVAAIIGVLVCVRTLAGIFVNLQV